MIDKRFIGFLNTPPLWTNEQFGVRQFEFPEIALNDFVARAIPGRLRLGHQMEHVFLQLIDQSDSYQVLLHNLPVKQENLTVGEIDFIVRNVETDQVVHIELTYKFYLIDMAISEPVHQLIGPNRRDMFFTKMEKIKQRQFPLLHTTEGKDALAQKGIDHEKIEHQCCFKAQLFAPYGTSSVHIRPLNKDCVQGYWLKFDDFNTDEFRGYSYYIPYKSEWVTTPHQDVEWQTHYVTLMDINLRMLKENAPMVWMRKSETEIEKFFIVWWS